jgi:hypothetical protein
MPNYPDPNTWEHANQLQRERVARSFNRLREKSVPVLPGPLFVEEETKVRLQLPEEVARRVLILWAVELRAEGMSQEEALDIIEHHDLWPSVSSEEKNFLLNENPSPEECQRLVWRLESIWVLMWALGYIEALDWPSKMCDVTHLVELMAAVEDDPEFITTAELRPAREIIDEQDFIMRIHWAIRDAYLHQGRMVPEDLDWSEQNEDYVPVHLSAAVGVVEQRHYTLNWLVNFLDPEDWDHVDTPT